MKIQVMISDGSQPIGKGIGPALEARDLIKILSNTNGPEDLKKKSIFMAGLILEMAGYKNGIKKAKEILESGKAYNKMKEIIKAQEGNPNIRPENIKIGKYYYTIKAEKAGYKEQTGNKSILVSLANYSIYLNKDWNLISLPLKPLNKTLPTHFLSIEGNYSKIFIYNSSNNNPWKMYNPDNLSISNLTLIDSEFIIMKNHFWNKALKSLCILSITFLSIILIIFKKNDSSHSLNLM